VGVRPREQSHALHAGYHKAIAEYGKLEAYTRHVLAIKDEIQAELSRRVEGRR